AAPAPAAEAPKAEEAKAEAKPEAKPAKKSSKKAAPKTETAADIK
ncbi:hypothetical protein HG543_34535, partial [Pyxidicoccus fallax]|nr:hypothetical protein [Pyxidicoccus fallax]